MAGKKGNQGISANAPPGNVCPDPWPLSSQQSIIPDDFIIWIQWNQGGLLKSPHKIFPLIVWSSFDATSIDEMNSTSSTACWHCSFPLKQQPKCVLTTHTFEPQGNWIRQAIALRSVFCPNFAYDCFFVSIIGKQERIAIPNRPPSCDPWVSWYEDLAFDWIAGAKLAWSKLKSFAITLGWLWQWFCDQIRVFWMHSFTSVSCRHTIDGWRLARVVETLLRE